MCHFMITTLDIPTDKHLMDLFIFYRKRPHFDYESNDVDIIKREVIASDRIALSPRYRNNGIIILGATHAGY